jgi:hypothetical protein
MAQFVGAFVMQRAAARIQRFHMLWRGCAVRLVEIFTKPSSNRG